MPFGFQIVKDKETGRKKIIRHPEHEPILRDVLDYIFKHQSKRKAIVYMNAKYHVGMGYNSFHNLIKNTFLCGEYRGNKNYCEAYLTREEFDKLQAITTRNVKDNSPKRDYIFSGLIKCPSCGRRLAGNSMTTIKKSGKRYKYKKYRCINHTQDKSCAFAKTVDENVLERLMLENIEQYLADVKLEAAQITDTDAEGAQETQIQIDDINEQIDRLNYSWQTGKIRTAEQYEADYAALIDQLERLEAEQDAPIVKDFEKIEAILHSGWRGIYDNLTDAYKRAFWRSFIQSIEIHWTTEEKKITRVNFF